MVLALNASPLIIYYPPLSPPSAVSLLPPHCSVTTLIPHLKARIYQHNRPSVRMATSDEIGARGDTQGEYLSEKCWIADLMRPTERNTPKPPSFGRDRARPNLDPNLKFRSKLPLSLPPPFSGIDLPDFGTASTRDRPYSATDYRTRTATGRATASAAWRSAVRHFQIIFGPCRRFSLGHVEASMGSQSSARPIRLCPGSGRGDLKPALVRMAIGADGGEDA